MKLYENKQFTLNDKGEILWQPLANNPLPGDKVAVLEKGETIFKPVVKMTTDTEEGKEIVSTWLDEYIDEKLKPLIQLQDDNVQGAPREIMNALYEAMGVVPRTEIEASIAQLDEQGRAQLRFKKVRLGPILGFLPELNKPAPIRLRAILWAVWNGKTLPVILPSDGVVSEIIKDKDIDPALYQMVGYPVYGPRAARIDMIDRVVVDIYDSSKDWKFQAKHQYCEWLGCTIDDLYLILEAMGHTRIPAEAPAEEGAPAQLDWFNLRRGKMSEDAKAPKTYRKPSAKTKTKPKGKGKKSGKPSKPKGPQTHSFTVKGDQKDQSSNPFAVLETLKNK